MPCAVTVSRVAGVTGAVLLVGACGGEAAVTHAPVDRAATSPQSPRAVEASGETKGKRAALLAFVDARGLVTSPEIRARIDACCDVALLDRWIARAATAVSIDAILSEPST